MKSTTIEVSYYVRGDKRYYAILKCISCQEQPSLKIIPVVHDMMGYASIEYYSRCQTSLCFTEWGCRREVQSLLKKTRKYLSTLQHKEICSQTIIL